MRHIILILMTSIIFTSCSSISCDSNKTQETVLELYKTEIKAELAWQAYYKEVFDPIENTYSGQQSFELLQLMAQMEGEEVLDLEEMKNKAKESIHDLANGKTIEEMDKFQPYIHYADSILSLGNIHLQRIMTTAKHPELNKCECKALLSFDQKMNINNIEVQFDIQESADGEKYVTIYKFQ